MKKTLYFALALALLFLLLAPGAVGIVVEKQFRNIAGNVGRSAPGYTWSVDDYDRGWFSSRARYHLELDPALVNELRENGEPRLEALPTLQSEAHIFHGPVFLAALGTPGVSLLPALAHSIDTVRVIGSGGDVLEVPGNISTRLGIFGRHLNIVDIGALATSFDEAGQAGTIDWAGMHLQTRFNSTLDKLDFAGEVRPFKMRLPAIQINTETTTFSARQSLTEFGFWAGEQRGRFGGISISAAELVDKPEGLPFDLMSMKEMSWDADIHVSGDEVNQTVSLEIERFELGSWNGGPLRLSADVERLNAAALGALLERMAPLPVATPDSPPGSIPDSFEMLMLVQALLDKGPEIDVHELSFMTPDGDISLKARLAFPPDAQGSLALMLAQLEATANLRISRALSERLVAYQPEVRAQLDGLLGMGFLLKKDDSLVLDAALKSGLLTINGQPIPLPVVF